jgi:tRNA (guanosine-2'-O-)-methyltransferase
MPEHARAQRIAAAAAQRLKWVRCAAEHLYHRHNVSAVLRTCDAVGVHDVHLVGPPPFTPSRGPSRGVYHWLRMHEHATSAEAIARIKADGYALWIADFADPPVPPAQVPVDRPICLWFGAELVGVSEEARAAADGVVTLPMHGFAQSLNISVAAAVSLYSVAERARALHGDDALLDAEDREAILASWYQRDDADLDLATARQQAMMALGEALLAQERSEADASQRP